MSVQYSIHLTKTTELRQLIKDKMTLQELAKDMKISRSTLNNLLLDPTIEQLEYILNKLGFKLSLTILNKE